MAPNPTNADLDKLLKVKTKELHASDVFRMNEEAVANAAGNVRRLINLGRVGGTLTPQQLSKLRGKHKKLKKCLRRFTRRDAKVLDNDQRVKEITVALLKLAGKATKAANEMREFRSTIDRATKIAGYADQALAIALAVGA